MPRKSIKNLVYGLIILLPVYLFFMRSSGLPRFRAKMVDIFSGPLRLISFPLKEGKKILYYHRTFEEYRRLKRELSRLQARVIEFEEIQKENIRLEKLLNLKRKMVFSSVTARVIGREPSQWNSTMLLDKGSEDNIGVGMPVINAEGVVGRIAEVGPHTSKVILLTDPRFSVAALIKDSRESGVVSGTLQGVCRMRYIRPEASINPGDVVLTSKLSTSFPENLRIGEVIRVQADRKNFRPQCLIDPAVTLSQIEEVLIILEEAAL